MCSLLLSFVPSHYWWSGVEWCEVFPARCPVADTCQALPCGNLWLHEARVTSTTTRLCAALVSLREATVNQRKHHRVPSSNSFPVEILLTHNHMFNTQISCCQFDVFDVVVGCCCVLFFFLFLFFFFYTLQKNKYYFVRFTLPPRRYFEVFDNLPHFDNGSCVCTLFC